MYSKFKRRLSFNWHLRFVQGYYIVCYYHVIGIIMQGYIYCLCETFFAEYIKTRKTPLSSMMFYKQSIIVWFIIAVRINEAKYNTTMVSYHDMIYLLPTYIMWFLTSG
jgi:hypothetical protein